jgi:glycosyltransferase involved in cell wall biosynthesis
LRSLQAQTLQDVRLLVIDDGSTDGTLEIVRRLAAEDPGSSSWNDATAGSWTR